MFRRPLIQRAKSEGANPVYYVRGQTAAGRYLLCVVIQFPDGKGYPVTARLMTPKEKQRLRQKTMKPLQLPQTDSIEEFAKFWDAHDLTDFEDQLEEVTESVFERRPATAMKIHLQPQEAKAVKRLAQAKGIDQEALIREWVLEKLHQE